jgi:sodium/pantothenate symporter
MELSPSLLLADAGANSAIIAFALYMAVVMVLAWLSNVLRQSKSFLSEYFLGSRSLGMWAFALTFAATSSSGGSFIGFPALVYSHGWIVSLWIGSYMIVPIVSMGLLAKRINQMAGRTGAITIPDVMRDRFESPVLGLVATVLIVFSCRST